MVQIIQEEPSLAAKFGGAFGSGLNQGFDKYLDFRHKLQLEQAKKKVEDSSLQADALRSIKDMRDIVARGRTGWNIFNKVFPEARADRAALDTAALSLERLAADMVGKGTLSKSRFDYMTKRLPSSGKSDAENQSILDEWEKIIGSEFEQSDNTEQKKLSKVKFNISNPEHKAKRDQLMKTYKGDRKKVEEILRREFEE